MLYLFHVETGNPGFVPSDLCSFLFLKNVQLYGFSHQKRGKSPQFLVKGSPKLTIPFILLRNGESGAPAPHEPQLAAPTDPLGVMWQKPLCLGAGGYPGTWRTTIIDLKSSGRIGFPWKGPGSSGGRTPGGAGAKDSLVLHP